MRRHELTDCEWTIIEPLLPEPGEAGIDELLRDADAIADALAEARGHIAEFDATELADFM